MKTKNTSNSKENLDALAQRCRELEHMLKHARMDADTHYADTLTLRRDRDACIKVANQNAEDAMSLRAEVEQLRQQAARYERLRRLNPRQFAELHQRNLAGERFDDMVDAL